jgi:hypothetical protein
MLGCSLSLNHECILSSQTAPGMPGKTPASASRCQAPRSEREPVSRVRALLLGAMKQYAFSFSHGRASSRQTTQGMSRKTRRKVEALSPLHASREEIALSLSCRVQPLSIKILLRPISSAASRSGHLWFLEPLDDEGDGAGKVRRPFLVPGGSCAEAARKPARKPRPAKPNKGPETCVRRRRSGMLQIRPGGTRHTSVGPRSRQLQ